ncbi:MAG: hypothetical protein FJW96_02740 [Actinobacteria bacterium]|nr:hypothetical protein [Actinomycetota bacterium]
MIRHNVTRTVGKVLLGSAMLAIGLAACSNSNESSASDAGVLFVLDTPSSVIEASGDTYRLVVPAGENLMWFTEVPERRAGIVSFDHWLETWDSMGFTEDPPNAAIVVDQGDGPRIHIIEMSDPLVEGHQVSFALTDIGSGDDGATSHAGRTHTHELAAGTMGHTELFIDSVSCTTACTTPSTTALTGTDAAELIAKIPAGSVRADSIALGPNLTINSMSVTKTTNGTFSATGTITLGGVIGINANANFVDGANWSITLAPAAASSIKLGTTGITLDPSTISGSITDSAGAITWKVSGSTITWPIASGASLTTQFSLGNQCPLANASSCPSGDNFYLGLPSGSLAINGFPTVNLAGGLTLDGSWARLDGTSNASATLSVGGASVSMGSPSLTIWRGPRTDSYDPNMVLPDTSAITNGTNLEFCGQFSIKIPTLVNQATGGCARWTPSGIVLGQVGLGSGMSLSGGTVPAGTTADIKGIGWSSLSLADIGKLTLPNGGIPGAISFSGVPTPLLPSGISLGGLSHLPGVVTSAIGLPSTNLDVAVTGQITANSIAIQGTVPVKINFGNEPFKVSIQSLTLGLAAGGGKGFSMNLGTSSDVTLGYGSSARVVSSSIQLKAATAPAIGFTLSLTANGMPAAGEPNDGLTPSTKLKYPSTAQSYLVNDLFGIKGVNLWAISGQIGWQGASPSIALGTTTYLNPTGAMTSKFMGCAGTCDDSDWMIGNLLIDMSLTNPCFAYSFDSAGGTGSIAIDGGVMKASSFQVGIAPGGCALTTGGSTVTLPMGFAGLKFNAAFGSATVQVATQVSTSGFEFNTAIDNIKVGGITLLNMTLNVSITESSSSVAFDALAAYLSNGSTASSPTAFMSLALHADMGADSNGLTWDVTGDICTDSSKKYCDPSAIASGLGSSTTAPTAPEQARDGNGNTPLSGGSQAVGFQLVQLHFAQSGSVGTCATIAGEASGYLQMSKSTYKLLGRADNALNPDGKTAFPGSQFKIDCNGIQAIDFGITFTHKSAYLDGNATKTLIISWNKATSTLQGSYGVSMTRNCHVHVTGHTYDAQQRFDIFVTVIISNTYAEFSMSGHVHTGRVDGYLKFYLNSAGDFVGTARLSVDVPWSRSTYHVDWDGL